MKHVEAVIFDWAGTTVDYGCMAPIYAMKDAFSHQNITVTLDEIRQPMGMLKLDHIKTILNMNRIHEEFKQNHSRDYNTNDIEKIYTLFEKNIFSILNQHTSLIDGVLTVQEHLRHHNIKIGSTTGYTKEMITIVAGNAKKQGYEPDYIISSDHVPRGRPYPYMLHQNLAALDVQDTRSVIKVGDTIIDILEGLHAGCWSIGVIKGSSLLGLNEAEVSSISSDDLDQKMNHVKQQMMAAGADFVIETISELPLIIDIIQQKINGTLK